MPPKTYKRYLEQDVREHGRPGDLWVSYNNVVYDISAFVADHPGGDDVLLPWAGRDVTSVMADGQVHAHSKLAYEILAPFAIGRLVHPLTTVDDGWTYRDDFHPDDTDLAADLAQTNFLDLTRPLIPQMWRGGFSKAFYLEQVHQPRHLPYSARLFPYAWLEVFTLTPWYFVPSFWLPIAATFFLLSALQFSPATSEATLRGVTSALLHGRAVVLPGLGGLAKTSVCWSTGVFLWTLLEYFFHRCVFHLDDKMPDHPMVLLLHFLMHGIHHFLPMDRLRLVMPPVLFFTLELPFTTLAHQILPRPVANGVISGAFTAYVGYDCLHYFFHHTKLPAAFRAQKSFHMEHHYRNFELGYGVTSKFWDVVFGTDYPETAPAALAT